MDGTIEKLKKNDGSYILPVTSAQGVFMSDGATSVETNLTEIATKVKQNKMYAKDGAFRPYVLAPFKVTSDVRTSGCTVALDSQNFLTGTSALKATGTTAGTSFSIIMDKTFDLSNATYLEIQIYIPDITQVDSVAMQFASPTAGGYLSQVPISNGWNALRFLRSSFSNSGTVAWNNVTQIEIKLNPMSGVTPSFTIDSLKSYIKNPYSNSKANIIFALDDANTSAYTVVYPYLESKGIKASFFCVGTYVGTYNHMTLNNMKELYSKGHDILNHSWSHPNPVGMTYAALAKDVQDMREYLWNNGFIKGIDIFAYPNALTTLFKQVVKDLEFNVGRNGSGSFMCGRKPYDLLNIPAYMLKTTDTIANMQSIIDTTIASGGTLIIFTHDLVASAPVSPNTTIAAWQGIVDYVCSQMQLGNCKVPTLSEWHDSLF